MIGERFYRLQVIGFVGVNNQKRIWECRCDCGKVISAPTGGLRSGNTKSCGCFKVDRMIKHGLYKSRTYRIWQAMLNRCRQEQYRKYYGNIKVCDRWLDFSSFLADMGHVPNGLTIDRRDNEKGYTPENCRWTTHTVQVRNTRRRVEYEHNGARRSLIEWAETLGLKYEGLRGRLRRGIPFERAVSDNIERIRL